MVDFPKSFEKDPDIMQQVVELTLLFDFYGLLLKESKRQVFEDYILNDLSLGEIASDRGISRQAVHDTVKRCSKELAEYEERLHLIQKFEVIKKKVNEIHQTAKKIKEERSFDGMNQIENLSNEILDVL